MPKSRRIISLAAISILASVPAVSQQLGHYLQGAAGIDGGTIPPAGLLLTYLPYVNLIDSVRGPNGNTVANTDLKFTIQAIGITNVTKVKIFGGTYGVSALIPWAKQRLNSDLLPSGSATAFDFTDVLIMPAMVGWSKKRMDILATYGFYAPAGPFNPNKLSNIGLGFWEHQIQLGTTVHLDEKKTLTASLKTTWEINHTKSGIDVKPGPMLTAEYGVGKKFLKGGLTLGASGYYYRKLISDSGADVRPITRGLIDQAMGLGPEATLILPLGKPTRLAALTFRYQPQFEVKNRPSGQVYMFNLTLLNLRVP